MVYSEGNLYHDEYKIKLPTYIQKHIDCKHFCHVLLHFYLFNKRLVPVKARSCHIAGFYRMMFLILAKIMSSIKPGIFNAMLMLSNKRLYPTYTME